jgi:precorrin-6B methylase 2
MKSLRTSRFQRFSDAVCMIVGNARLGEIATVLDIGFGNIREIEALTLMFPNACVRAIESDGHIVSMARRGLRAIGLGQVVVLAKDAQFLSGREIASADVVVIRHPNVSENISGWGPTFRWLAAHLARSSILICSTYSLFELIAVQDTLQDAGLTEVPGAPYSKCPVALDGSDRHIVSFAKNSQTADWRNVEELCC